IANRAQVVPSLRRCKEGTTCSRFQLIHTLYDRPYSSESIRSHEIAGGHRSENVFHSKLHDPGIEGTSNLTEGVAGQAQSKQRRSGGGEQRPESVRDVVSLCSEFQPPIFLQ